MKAKIQIVEGMSFGRLKVLAEVPKEERLRRSTRAYRCECSCGKVVVISSGYLRAGETRSCGCLRTDLASKRFTALLTTHGMSRHPIYRVWVRIITRCYDPSFIQWHDYGGRGISVCEEWRHDPTGFIEWASKNGWSADLEINRIDNDGGYSPSNCNFVTHSENQKNKRKYTHHKGGAPHVT